MLVLASASPRRRELIAGLGIAFRVEPAGADESLPEGADPDAAARVIAERKARRIAVPPGDVVIAADTLVVAADGEILGKPLDAADARRMLRKLSGTTHRVVTGVCVSTRGGAHVEAESVSTSVTMRALSEAEIDAYVASGESFDKAGAYAIQETGDRFVTRVEGSRTNVVGLPMETVERMLRRADPATGAGG